MSDTYLGPPIPVTPAWSDVAATYTAMANTDAWVQNQGPGQIRVAFSSSGSSPTNPCGETLNPGDTWRGTAAHCYVQSLGSSASVTAGLA